MGIDNRDADGGRKQQGDLDSGSESRQENRPDKSNNPNGQRERGSESQGSEGGGPDATQADKQKQQQGGSGQQR